MLSVVLLHMVLSAHGIDLAEHPASRGRAIDHMKHLPPLLAHVDHGNPPEEAPIRRLSTTSGMEGGPIEDHSPSISLQAIANYHCLEAKEIGPREVQT